MTNLTPVFTIEGANLLQYEVTDLTYHHAPNNITRGMLMFGNPYKGLRPICGLRLSILRAAFILVPVLASCQTGSKPDSAAKEAAFLETQKSIVRNALDNGKPETALENLRTLIRQFPDDSGLRNLMGITQLTLKNSQRAIREFQAAYKMDKEIATGLNLSSALISAGDNDRAIRLLTQLIKQAEDNNYPYKERLYHNLGYSYAKVRNNAKAEQWYKQALDENPAFFLSQLELARLYEKSNRPTMAIAAYRKSIDRCLVCIEPVEALASLYVQAGRFAEARQTVIQFEKVEGVSAQDRTRAQELLKRVTLSGLPGQKRAG